MAEQIILGVDGMGCQSCIAAVEKAVHQVSPNAEVTVDLKIGTVTITNPVSPPQTFAAAITAAGYDLRP